MSGPVDCQLRQYSAELDDQLHGIPTSTQILSAQERPFGNLLGEWSTEESSKKNQNTIMFLSHQTFFSTCY